MRMIKTTSIILAWLLFNMASANAADAKFTGTQSCSNCHAQQNKDWQGSHHDQAMQHAGPEAVLGDFNNASIVANGFKSTFFKKDGQFWVNTDGADGKLQDYQITYTFGVTPLQQIFDRIS